LNLPKSLKVIAAAILKEGQQDIWNKEISLNGGVVGLGVEKACILKEGGVHGKLK